MEDVLKIIYLNKESKQKVTTIMTELKNLETMKEKAYYIKNTPSIPNIIEHYNFGKSLVICKNTKIAIFQVEEIVWNIANGQTFEFRIVKIQNQSDIWV